MLVSLMCSNYSQTNAIIKVHFEYSYGVLVYLQQNDKADGASSEQKKPSHSSSKSLKMNCTKKVFEHKKPLGRFNIKIFKARKHKERVIQVDNCEAQEESIFLTNSDQATAVAKQNVFDGLKISPTSAEHTDSEKETQSAKEYECCDITKLTEQVKKLERRLEVIEIQKEGLHMQLEDKDRQLSMYVAESTLQIKKLQNYYSTAMTENEQLQSHLKDKHRQLNAKDIHIAEMTVEVRELEKNLCRATQRLQNPDIVCTCNNTRDRLPKPEGQFTSAAEEMVLMLAEREQEIVSLQQQLEDIKKVRAHIKQPSIQMGIYIAFKKAWVKSCEIKGGSYARNGLQ